MESNKIASFEKFVVLISKLSDGISQIAVMAMMLVTIANILGRLFWRPIYGTFDYVSFFSVILVAFALAYCAVQRGHISVELIVTRLPQRIQGIIGCFTNILSLGIFIIVIWQCVVFAERMIRAKQVTMTALLPFYPFIYVIALGCFLLCLVIIVDLIKSLDKAVKG
jgi:TRAP-type C4-dicarboxylate transport system permease small subunit